MGDRLSSYRAVYWLMFLGLAVLVIFVQLLPISLVTGGWAGPDVLLAITMAWGLRRPDYLPPLLAGAVMLMADLILQRPPGLWAALVVLALELLRARNQIWRDLPFLLEWGVISVVMAAVVLLYWLVLAVFFVVQPAIGLYLIQLISTILVYPPVVLISATVLGVRKVAPGQVDALGHRL
ncbi:rod shape-determining protein MreD [Frigidibacter sp. ROC022]|uniref:rod shape-determining protein MreD n=1 Tax=Frigidibacter sp. ROC022 TaxID=2971796 RepID=UPI00215A4227|nr:rod shape-determining protein MreD [Frigidibacter sp. ROC022]MCR8726619.1 rod shape-determining protein MreD [Frigidibacter sp. ROC022]